MFQDEIPSLRGKMALMPLPAWKQGGRRTSVWGGTGLIIAKQTKHRSSPGSSPSSSTSDARSSASGSGHEHPPALKDAWTLPEFGQPNPY